VNPPSRPKGVCRSAQPEATPSSLAQLKIVREVITLAVSVPVAILFTGAPRRLDGVWSGLCLAGAVYFTFRA
jgi:uncharacterized protein (DUF486 family)